MWHPLLAHPEHFQHPPSVCWSAGSFPVSLLIVLARSQNDQSRLRQLHPAPGRTLTRAGWAEGLHPPGTARRQQRGPAAEEGCGEETPSTPCKPALPVAKRREGLTDCSFFSPRIIQQRYHVKYCYFSHSAMRNINWPNFAEAVTILLAV